MVDHGDVLSPKDLIDRYSLKPGFRLAHLNNEDAEGIGGLSSLVSRSEDFWVDRLAGAQYPELRAVHCSELSETLDVREQHVEIDGEVLERLTALGVGPQIAMAAAFALFIGRRCGVADFVLGYRDDDLAAAVGQHADLFAEYVPLRVVLDTETTFDQALRSVINVLEATRTHKTFARDIWLRYPELKARAGRPDQAVAPVSIVTTKGRTPRTLAQGSAVTLSIPDDLADCSLIFDASLIAETDVGLLNEGFAAFLAAGLMNEGSATLGVVGVLGAAERRILLGDWNRTQVDWPSSTCIHELVEQQAAETPSAVALVCGETSLTYEELNARSNRVAQRLRELGIATESLVGVHLHRSVDMMVGVLGVLKAGGAYLPLDPSFPEDRLSFMIDDSRCGVIITETALRDSFSDGDAKAIVIDAEFGDWSGRDPVIVDVPVRPDNLAYVLYTSGSTGRPKGVMLEHRNVVNFFTGMNACVEGGSGGIWLAVTTLSFDISVLELLWTLTRGFTVVIYAGEDKAVNGASRSRQTAGENDGYSIPDLMKLHQRHAFAVHAFHGQHAYA